MACSWRGVANVDSLVSQLLELENSLTTLVLETVLKIQTLTETKMFLLLENPEDNSRRFCGDKLLVKQFRKSSFGRSGRGDDFQISLDPKVTLLVEQKREKPKRKLADGEGRGGGGEADCDDASPSKRARPFGDLDPNFETDPEVNIGKDGQILAIKEEPWIYEGLSLLDDRETKTMDLTNKGSEDVEDEDFEDDEEGDESGEEEEDDDDDDNYENVDDEEIAKLTKSASTAEKMWALKEMKTPVLAFTKQTMENKLLNNLLFGYGKSLAQKCPFNDSDLHLKEVQIYVKIHTHKFLQNFPRLRRVKRKNCPVSVCATKGPNFYMKQIITNGFRSYAPHFFEWRRNTWKKEQTQA